MKAKQFNNELKNKVSDYLAYAQNSAQKNSEIGDNSAQSLVDEKIIDQLNESDFIYFLNEELIDTYFDFDETELPFHELEPYINITESVNVRDAKIYEHKDAISLVLEYHIDVTFDYEKWATVEVERRFESYIDENDMPHKVAWENIQGQIYDALPRFETSGSRCFDIDILFEFRSDNKITTTAKVNINDPVLSDSVPPKIFDLSQSLGWQA